MNKLTWSSPKLTNKVAINAALLIALQIVLSKISLGPENVFKISLGFIGTAVVGYYLGPWLGGLAMIIADLISNTVLASTANFFIGFTFGAFLAGVIAGAFLHKQEITWQRQVAYAFCQILIINTCLTTTWIHLLWHTPFKALLMMRLPKEIISWPIEAFVGFIVIHEIARRRIAIKE